MPRIVAIELTAVPRFNSGPCRYTPKERQCFDKWFETALAAGWIRKSSARNTCGSFFIPKKNGKDVRFIVNYVPLNEITKSMVYAPRADRFMRNDIARHTWYTKIDLENAFYHLWLRDGDQWKAAFRTPHGVYEPLVVMQGMKNGPGEFQLWIEHIISEVLGENVCVHIDDILIHTDSREECREIELRVREILARHNININIEKSVSLVTKVEYCGFIFEKKSVRPVDRSAEFATWPIPRNLTELRCFLGTANQFADHVIKFGTIAAPLYAATGKRWVWSETQKRAFFQLREACCNHMACTNHRPEDPATIITDASLYGLGGILKQRGRITAIWSRSLTGAERNYTANERELLAVVSCLRAWNMYLDLSPAILVKTDNMINATLLKPNQTNRRINRWIDDLQRYPIEWEHIPGVENPADGPSRRRDFRPLPRNDDAS